MYWRGKMGPAADLDQTKTVELDRGLFLIQYQAADDSDAPPRVLVAPAPGSEGKVAFILHPDATEPTLWQPETALVVRADTHARLQVRVVASRPQGSRAATVRVEPIRPGQPYRERETAASPSAVEGMRVVAHVAGIGDVAVGQNVWIAGPAAPSRIEGFVIQWPGKPNNLDIRYAVRFPGPQNDAPNMVPLGAFAGTRGRALPVTALVLEVTGRTDVQFVAEALFLNSPILKVKGTRIALTGPTGREPMIGLRINLETLSVADPVLAAPPTSSGLPNQSAPAQGTRKAGPNSRVKVFRSRPK
jgi:hypothetical protein